MAVGKREKRFFAKAGVDGPFPFVDEIELLEGWWRISRFSLGGGSEDGNLGWSGYLALPPRFLPDSRPALPRVGTKDLVITVPEILGIFVFGNDTPLVY